MPSHSYDKQRQPEGVEAIAGAAAASPVGQFEQSARSRWAQAADVRAASGGTGQDGDADVDVGPADGRGPAAGGPAPRETPQEVLDALVEQLGSPTLPDPSGTDGEPSGEGCLTAQEPAWKGERANLGVTIERFRDVIRTLPTPPSESGRADIVGRTATVADDIRAADRALHDAASLGVGRLRSEVHPEGKDAYGKIADAIALRLAAHAGIEEIQAIYRSSAGGITAVGRAHDVEEAGEETSLFSIGATIGGKTLSREDLPTLKQGSLDAAARAEKTVAGARRPRLDARGEPGSAGPVLPVARQERSVLLDGVAAKGMPAQEQSNVFSGAIQYQDRGLGQYAAMGMNAAAYAGLALGADQMKAARWEWLHIRAASLGGPTDSSNLVVGTRDANTHMMPFEAHLVKLAKVVEVTATWRVDGQIEGAPHAFDTILLSWEVTPPNAQLSGSVRIRPLKTGSPEAPYLLSKAEVQALELRLEASRRSFAPPGSTGDDLTNGAADGGHDAHGSSRGVSQQAGPGRRKRIAQRAPARDGPDSEGERPKRSRETEVAGGTRHLR